MEPIRIRRVDPNTHADELYEFQREFFPIDSVLAVGTGNSDWWLVYEGDDAIGFAGLAPSSRWSGWGYLCRAGVRPDYSGRGIQRRLIRVRESWAKKQRRYTGLLSDTTSSPASANNLIRCGYRIYEPANPYTPYPETIYFRKKLQ